MEAKPTENGIHLDAEFQKRLEAFARARGLAPVVLLREAIEECEANHKGGQANVAAEKSETLFDRWSRKGYVGCVKGTPRDLSSDAKYLDGLGRG